MGIASRVQKAVKVLFTGEDEKDKLKRGYGYRSQMQPTPYGTNVLEDTLRIDQELLSRYADYEEMDDYPECGSALDIYADDATVLNAEKNRTLWPKSKSRVAREVIEDLLDRNLKFEEHAYAIARTLAKYGNAFAEVLASKEGVVGLNFLPPASVRRVEDEDGRLYGYVQNIRGVFGFRRDRLIEALKKNEKSIDDSILFQPWEIVHFRLMGKRVDSEYGWSVLESGRWAYRRLVMAEDAALVYKLTRSPARFAYYIDVGDLAPDQALAYVNDVKNAYKKKQLWNPSSNKLEFKNNPLSSHEDLWLPMRNGQESTRVDVISGPDYQSMELVEYFQGKLFAAIKVPRSYLGQGGETNRASLAQEDVRFARTVLRLQRAIKAGMMEVSRIHLAILGIDPDRTDYNFEMTVPSNIFELAQIELRNAKADNARALEEYFPKEWILANVFGHTADDATALVKLKGFERRQIAKDEVAIQDELMREYPDVMQQQMVPIAPQSGAPPPANESRNDNHRLLTQISERLEDLELNLSRFRSEHRKSRHHLFGER